MAAILDHRHRRTLDENRPKSVNYSFVLEISRHNENFFLVYYNLSNPNYIFKKLRKLKVSILKDRPVALYLKNVGFYKHFIIKNVKLSQVCGLF